MGGDEFAILLESTASPAATEAVVQRLIAQLEMPFVLEGSSLDGISASVGVAIASPGDERTAEQLVGDADRAMYTVKKGPKGAYAFAEH
jgi:diguanylate cyclase (GGDEF)-like protein